MLLVVSYLSLFGSFVALSHDAPPKQPGRAVWAASVGCVRCPLPSFLPDILNLQSFKLPASSRSHSFCTPPFTSNPGVPPWLPRWECSWFLLLPGGVCDLPVLRPGLQESLARFFFRRRGFICIFLCIFLGEYPFLFLF